MAEHTYWSKDFTAVITWDITQITQADEGVVLGDIELMAYKPSVLPINEDYKFKHGNVYYGFVIPMDRRGKLATRILLGATATITLPMHYVRHEVRA